VVTSKLGSPPDGETVTFKEGTTVLGTGALSGGMATFTTSTLPVGTNAIKAWYGSLRCHGSGVGGARALAGWSILAHSVRKSLPP
jgi:hypothetical protein